MEELEKVAKEYAEKTYSEMTGVLTWSILDFIVINAFKAGAKWQKEQMMTNATEVTVHIDAGGYPYTPEIELYDYDKDVPLAKEGDKYKVVLIKED